MNILHIEDEEADRIIIEGLIRRTKHWKYSGAATLREGMRIWSEEFPQVVLIDLTFPEITAREVLDAIKAMAAGTVVIGLSGNQSQEAVNQMWSAGCVGFINKNDLKGPEAFHDTIIKFVEVNLGKKPGDTAAQATLKQLAQAVWFGNGSPSIMARLEAGAIAMLGMEKQIHELKEIGETRRKEVNASFSDIIKLIGKNKTELRIYAFLLPALYLAFNFALTLFAEMRQVEVKRMPPMPDLQNIGH